MSLGLHDAKEIAWAAFLDAVGEPLVPNWRDAGFGVTHLVRHRENEGHPYEHWYVIIYDPRAPTAFPGWHFIVARVWVDKVTGHCDVWVNEAHDPTTTEADAWAQFRSTRTELSGSADAYRGRSAGAGSADGGRPA